MLLKISVVQRLPKYIRVYIRPRDRAFSASSCNLHGRSYCAFLTRYVYICNHGVDAKAFHALYFGKLFFYNFCLVLSRA